MSILLCKFCRVPIKEGKYLKTATLVCHSSCFKCAECKEAIGSSYSQAPDTNLYYHPTCLSKANEDRAIKLGHVCKWCSKPCHVGKYLTLSTGEQYHSDCFKCQECNQLIEGQYIPYGNSKAPLHSECARKRDRADAIAQGRICKSCGKPCFEGRIITVSDSELYHAQCFLCTGCRKPITAKFAQYGDGRLPYHFNCLPGADVEATDASSTNYGGSSKTKPAARPNATSSAKRSTGPTETKPRLCKRCKHECSSGQFCHTSDGAMYHADCFRCSDPSCGQLITGPYTMHGEPPQPYHPACGKELFAPRCCLCCTAIEGQFYRHPFFDTEQYCLSHEGRTTCFACGRREPLPESRREGFVDLMDGRALCGQCSSTTIVDVSEAVGLYRSIVEFMGGALGLTIPAEMRDVPILLVDVPTLNTNREKLGEVLGHHGIEDPGAVTDLGVHSPPGDQTGAALRPEAVIRGITLSKCSEVRHYTSTRLSTDGGRGSLSPGQLPQVYKVTQTRDVSAVLVLYGLPRDLTASILAHEAMHVWLKLHRGFPFRMPPKLEEGLCQVIAYMYLESLEKGSQVAVTGPTASNNTTSPARVHRQASLKAQSPRPNSATTSRRPSSAGSRTVATNLTSESSKLPKVATKRPKTLLGWFRQQILNDNSPIYGDGFKEAYSAVSAVGLTATLAHIQKHHALPPVPRARLPPVR